jgi:hypothetical protein
MAHLRLHRNVERTGGWTLRIARAVPKPARKTNMRKPPKILLRAYRAHSRSIKTTGRVGQMFDYEVPALLTLNYCDTDLGEGVREHAIFWLSTHHAPVCR